MPSQTPDLRSGIVGILQLLSSPQKQLQYELKVPAISVPTELLCMWFDDLYLPNSQYFNRCFSSGELEAMATFNVCFARQEELLPEPRDGIKTWLQDETWLGIVQEASKTLAVLEPRSTDQK